MPQSILANFTASVSELKRNPIGTIAAGKGFPVAILSRNEPEFYCIPAKTWEAMVECLEDIEDNTLVDERANGKVVNVRLNDL